jgi:fatty-acyl-CoA synthase
LHSEVTVQVSLSRDLPLRSIADVKVIEQRPLQEWLGSPIFIERLSARLAAANAGRTAISYVANGQPNVPPHVTSFGELRERIAKTVTLFQSVGLGREDVIAVLLPAVPQLWWSVIAALSTGIVFPINWMFEPPQLARLLVESRAKAIVALGPTPGFKIWEALRSVLHELPADTVIWSVQGPEGEFLPESDLDSAATRIMSPGCATPEMPGADDVAAYIHSGGTTGSPKIIKLTQRNLAFRHWTLETALKSEPDEVVLHDTPLFHVGGIAGRCLPPLASGASIVIPSIWGARDKRYIGNYWRFVEKYGITRLSGVPTTLAVLAKNPPRGEDLSSLRPYFITGSTAMPMAIRREFERVSGVRVLNSYGMTENTASIAIDPRDGPTKEGSSGIRLPFTDVRTVIIDDDGKIARDCDPGEVGMILVRSPGTTPGYLDPAHNKTGFEEGWLITGDLGRLDEDAYLFVTGRAKDVIIRGGHNIDPALIEEPLSESVDVLLAAAVGKPDPYAGESPVVYVQLAAGSRATEQTLRAFLSERIVERAAMPKDIFIVDQIPLTGVGKPIKGLLRQDAAERSLLSALAEATGLSPQDGTLGVSVGSNANGTLVTITLDPGLETGVDGIVERIQNAMSSYHFAYDIVRVKNNSTVPRSAIGES